MGKMGMKWKGLAQYDIVFTNLRILNLIELYDRKIEERIVFTSMRI